jgi:hypothetical protein
VAIGRAGKNGDCTYAGMEYQVTHMMTKVRPFEQTIRSGSSRASIQGISICIMPQPHLKPHVKEWVGKYPAKPTTFARDETAARVFPKLLFKVFEQSLFYLSCTLLEHGSMWRFRPKFGLISSTEPRFFSK